MNDVTTHFVAAHAAGDELISLVSANGHGGPVRISVDDWSAHAPDSTSAAVDYLLGVWVDNILGSDGRPLATLEAESLRLHPELVAALTEAQASSLGLPRSTPLTLEISCRGIFPREDFELEAVWKRPGNRATRVTNSGARQSKAGQDWRIPDPLFSVLRSVEQLNQAATRDGKQAALARLRVALDQSPEASEIEPDLFLSRLRVKYAAGFSLDLKTTASGFDFDPVLFAPVVLEAQDDEGLTDQFDDSLLTDIQARSFEQHFRELPEARKAYVLHDGTLLFLDPTLSEALGIVKAAQESEPDERKRFARNPRRYISEALGQEPSDLEVSSDVFIETQQYSERVAGIDLWRQPVLPWVLPFPNRWLPEKFGLQVGSGDDAVSLELHPDYLNAAIDTVEQAISAGKESVEISGVEVPATPQTLHALGDLAALKGEAAQEDPAAPTTALPRALQERYFLQVTDNLEEVNYAPLGRATYPEVAADPVWPSGMLSTPKSYQITGFAWLVKNFQSDRPGCLLADDMGLGKTFQALSFLVWLRQNRTPAAPVLIVAPAGLLANWEAEIRQHVRQGILGEVFRAFGPGLTSIRAGAGPDIKTAQAGLDNAPIADAGVVLTTYETMRDYHMSFARVKFGCIVYDEAQKVKNPASQTTRAAKTLNSRFQLAMTGTPVENRLQDLWSIIDVIHPGLLGSSREFEREYPADDRQKLAELNRFLIEPADDRPPVMLRRMKTEALDGLPEKIVDKVEYEMPPTQANEYLTVVNRAMVADSDEGPGRMLKILHRLRGTSLHPVDPTYASNDEEYFEKSARTKALLERLDRVRESGEKALIFCENLAMQSVLAGYLERRYELSRRVERIHGGITGDLRQRIVDEFQSAPPGFDVLIISPKAGGVGLTLTAANHVFHLSRWWNPAVEDQATDRVYRLGQQKKVYVHLLQAVHPNPAIGPNSFDRKLDELIERKRGISSGLLAPGESESDIAELFNQVVFAPAADHAPASLDALADHVAPSRSERQDQETKEHSAGQADAESLAPSFDPIQPPRASPLARPRTEPGERRDFPTRVVYRPRADRDLSIFTEPVRDRAIRSLAIRDPYGAAGPDNRLALVEFIRILMQSARAVEGVSFTTLDADSIQTFPPETDLQQWDDLFRKWDQAFPDSERPRFIRLSRRQTPDFHDREVSALLEDGQRVIWDLGRGLEALFNKRRECRVVVTIY